MLVKRSSSNARRDACELKRKVSALRRFAAAAAIVLTVVAFAPLAAQHAEPAAAGAHAAQPDEHAADAAHGEAEGHHGLSGLIWPTVNFAILVGALYYFLSTPFGNYLRDRHATIRKDLVAAGELRTTATAQLAEIDQRVKALPGELEALRARGREEIAAEERRIHEQSAQERARLVEQTRREIDLQVRLAKRELVEHAAELSVQLATDRIAHEITPADHQRLTERYLTQVEKGQAH